MKTGMLSASPKRSTAVWFLWCVILFLGAGCTHVAKRHQKSNSELNEHSRALTTAVVDTLQLQPLPNRDEFTDLALRLAREDQRIEKLPLTPMPVAELLGVSATNASPRERERIQSAAADDIAQRFERIEKLLAREQQAEEKLLAFGEQFEIARNLQRAQWFKRGTGLFLLIGGIIALAIFFPAALPILGRLVGWLVGKIPGIAGAMGVVSVKAFDAVVRAIEQTKLLPADHKDKDRTQQFGNQTELQSSTQFGAVAFPAMDQLRVNLSREMDAAHKRLVRTRKSALGLDR